MHDHWQELLPDYITDELSEQERLELEKHLASCSECRQFLDDWRAVAKVARAEAESRTLELPAFIDLFDGNLNPPFPEPMIAAQLAVEEERDMTFISIRQQKSYAIPWTAVAVLILTFFFSLLLLGGLDLQPAPLPLQQGQGLGDIPEDPIALFQLYIDEVWNKQNMEAIPLLLSENHVHHDVSMTEDIVGLEAFAEYVAFEHNVLPDVTFTVDSLVANGNEVVGRVTMSYEEFSKTVLVNATITDGKLAETWFDVGTMVEGENSRIAELWIQRVWNLDDVPLEDYAELVTSPYTFNEIQSLMVNITMQPSNLYEWNRTLREASSDFHMIVEQVIADGDFVVIYATGQGTMDGHCNFCLKGSEPTGEVSHQEYVFIFKFEDGKIAEEWWFQETDSTLEDLAAVGVLSRHEQTRAYAQRYVDEIWNAEEFDMSVFEEMYAPRPQFGYNTNTTERMEQDVFAELHTAIREAFVDSQLAVEDMIVEDGKAVIQFTWAGTHTATFEYQDIVLPPSNEVVETSGMIVLNIPTFGAMTAITQETWYADFPFLADFEQIAEG